ncbi:MAG: thioredoxin family protein [Planctomycetes bacterium]|nr:thioredoxin family protein [Planctomycetota bacterium]
MMTTSRDPIRARWSALLGLLALALWSLQGSAAPEEARRAGDRDHDHAGEDHDHAGEDAPEEAGRGASELIPWFRDLEKAFEEARKSEKPLMVDFEADWCVWCKKLDRETYGDERVIRFVRANFIAVKVDADKQPDVKEKLSVSGLPTILFLSPTGEELLRITGYRAPEKFLEEARKPANSAATLALLKKEAEEKPGDIDAQRAYARALFAAGGSGEAIRILRSARERTPEDAALLLDLADVLQSAEQLTESREAYEAVLALGEEKAGPERAKVYLPLGRLLIRLREHPKAVEILGRYIELAVKEKRADPERWEAHFLRGYAHAVLKDAEKALADLEMVQAEAPDSTWGLRASYIIEVVRGG